MRLALLNLLVAASFGLLLSLSVPTEARAELWIGDSAYVLGTNGSGVKVRSGPGPTYDVLGVAPERARATVLNGPRSDGDLTWYQVRTTDGAGERIRGWVAAMYLASGTSLTTADDAVAGTRSFEGKITGFASGYGGAGFYTATGTRVHWGTVAVDPRYIPLGSLMLIDGLDGVFTAEDIGGGVRGPMVDVWFPDLQSALSWSTRYRTVTILREGY